MFGQFLHVQARILAQLAADGCTRMTLAGLVFGRRPSSCADNTFPDVISGSSYRGVSLINLSGDA